MKMIRDRKKNAPAQYGRISIEDRALSFHLEYGGTYARSFNHISLFS